MDAHESDASSTAVGDGGSDHEGQGHERNGHGDEGHGHGGTRAIIAAFFANLGIAIAKFIGYAVTGAASMLAEGIHSVADTSNQALLIWGQRSAKRRPTPEHPFGYGRDRYFWAFVVSMVLFSLGGLFAIFEGIEKLRHPHEISSPWWAIGILLTGILLEGYSFRTAVVESNRIRGNAPWAAFIRHAKSPELPVVLLEDFGALVGLVIALFGVSLSAITGNPAFDAIGSISIGALLVIIAWILAREMKSLLIGESVQPLQRRAIDAAITASDEVVRVIHRKTQHLGPDDVLVAAKVEFRHDMSVTELAAAINAAEARIRDVLPIATRIYIEPDIHRGEEPAASP